MKEREIIINIERCTDKTVEEARKIDVLDELGSGENSVELSTNKKEKRSAKKPPRPPSALSLDAADQKLIKEISELLMIKRARIERIKALKKIKAASKPSSPSTSSTSNFIAIFFTILLCILIIFQGCHPSSIGIHSSTKPNAGSIASVHMLSEDGSPNLGNQAEGGKATH